MSTLALALSKSCKSLLSGSILMGPLSNSMPVPHVALGGALVPALMLLGFAHLQGAPELCVSCALMGLPALCAITAPLDTVARPWMPRTRRLPIRVASVGRTFSRRVVPFIAHLLTMSGGWREAYFAMALVHLPAMLPLALGGRTAPK